MACSFPIFTGNCPKSVNRDAKYVIRLLDGKSVVTLTYLAENGERWLVSTEQHSELVEIVNAVKRDCGGSVNGPFYINEYGQVIVPVGSEVTYYLAADHYDLPLRFMFEGHIISGEGVDLRGQPLQPGDLWAGPHVGIPYILEAGREDIYYVSFLRRRVTKKVRLSCYVGTDAAATTAQRIRQFKGPQGGRFYVNEWKEIFAPVDEATGLEYRYIGPLEDDDPWFPKPRVE